MKLSILIPSKNEPYLLKTIADIEDNIGVETEVMAMEDDGIGQRSLTNVLAHKAKGEYIMKVDAHCSFSPGFDKVLLDQIDNKTILSPMPLPLDGESWTVNGKKQMLQFGFGPNFTMQHMAGDAGETMCLQGSAWMVSRRNYFDWDLGDETMPSWGGQGVELGIKAFLNGGRCMTTRDAWYGHVFREKDEDFPYDRGENPGLEATKELKRRYNNRSIQPLVEKFGYPLGWRPSDFEIMV